MGEEARGTQERGGRDGGWEEARRGAGKGGGGGG